MHWVHSSPDSPAEWSLQMLLLAFREVKDNHSGDNLALLVMEIINKVGLSSKLADDSAQVPKLQKKNYANYRLTSTEWHNLDLLCQVLKHPAKAQQKFSSKCVPTVYLVFPTIEFLLTSLEAVEKDASFTLIHYAIKAGIKNLTKWYHRLDTCHIYSMANVLDPSIKLCYIKKNWGPDFVSHLRTILTTIFDKYN
ncbi:hypothetical protein EI94DRAFT_1798926 [Lactarius quietus]|nr:hypothetical protein EI94DRAFT_1798926 [Lactarius quietus]